MNEGTTDETGPAGGSRTQLDRVFDALSHPYRRRILLLVSDHNPRDEAEFGIDDLATDEDTVELFKTDLYHKHLPALDEKGYVDWDRDTDTVTRGENFEKIGPLLELIEDHQDELPAGWP